MADKKHDDGGPAHSTDTLGGMTLLDYFAGKALAAIITEATDDACQRHIPGPEFEQFACFAAYNFGAAMIAEKRRREKEGAN